MQQSNDAAGVVDSSLSRLVAGPLSRASLSSSSSSTAAAQNSASHHDAMNGSNNNDNDITAASDTTGHTQKDASKQERGGTFRMLVKGSIVHAGKRKRSKIYNNDRVRAAAAKKSTTSLSPAATAGFDLQDDDDDSSKRQSMSLSGSPLNLDDEEEEDGDEEEGDNVGGVENATAEDISSVVTERTSNVQQNEQPEQQVESSRSNQQQQSTQPTLSSKSPEGGMNHLQQQQQQPQQQPEGWRVKLYRLNADGSWDDCGTGRILCLYKSSNDGTQHDENDDGGSDAWVYRELGEPTLCMHSEVASTTGPQNVTNTSPRILLRTRILLREAYQRQGENIITWCEPYLEEGNPAQGVDLALSFQDNAGCMYIWKQVTQVQARASELIRAKGKSGKGGSAADMAHAVAAARHADLQRRDQQEIWANVASEASANSQNHHPQGHINIGGARDPFEDSVSAVVNSYHDANPGMPSNTPQLPNPPTLSNLEDVADTIAAVQVSRLKDHSPTFVWHSSDIANLIIFTAYSTEGISCYVYCSE
jgi:hypothetical protein